MCRWPGRRWRSCRSYCCLASTAPNSPTSAGSPRHYCWRSSATPSSAASYRIRTIATARASSGPLFSRSRLRRRAHTRWSGSEARCSGAKVLRQFEPLRLVIRADARAVKLVRPRQHFLVDQAADDLAVLEDERHFARAHFQYRARAQAAGAGIAKTRIEEAGIVHAEFADQRIERHHLGGIIGRHLHSFVGGQDVELVGIEDQALVGARRDRLPEIGDVIGVALIDLDHRGVPLGAIADDARAVAVRRSGA